MGEGSWPVELFVPRGRDALRITYEDGTVHEMAAEYLRVFTPSAERTGHGSPVTIGGKSAVTIKDVRAVGRYAVRIVFSDGHDTGLYSFPILAELGAQREANWDSYLSELATLGLSRDTAGSAPRPR